MSVANSRWAVRVEILVGTNDTQVRPLLEAPGLQSIAQQPIFLCPLLLCAELIPSLHCHFMTQTNLLPEWTTPNMSENSRPKGLI